MSLPTHAVTLPAALEGQRNGQLDPAELWPVAGGQLLIVAARAWSAMVDAAHADGVDLEAGDTYRDLETQMRLFMERHTLTELPGRPSSVWLGTRYWLLPGQDEAAVPGNSNHGWGLAIDVRNVNQAGRLMWLTYNADRFGFSAELQSEAWHWHYYAGDPGPIDEDYMTDEQIDKLAKAVAREIMTYPVVVHDFDANADTTQPLAIVEGWRNNELSMIRRK